MNSIYTFAAYFSSKKYYTEQKHCNLNIKERTFSVGLQMAGYIVGFSEIECFSLSCARKKARFLPKIKKKSAINHKFAGMLECAESCIPLCSYVINNLSDSTLLRKSTQRTQTHRRQKETLNSKQPQRSTE